MNRIIRVTPRLPVADLAAAVAFYRGHFAFARVGPRDPNGYLVIFSEETDEPVTNADGS